MSREAKAPSSSSHPQTSRTSTATQHPPQPPAKEPEHSNKENEQIEEDDSDFVLVVNKKKHQQQIETARKQRQSYDHQAEDYDHHNNYSRRRKYRDRGGGGGEKGFRRKKNHDKENTQNKTGSTSSSSSHAAPVTLPTVSSPPPSLEPKPHPQQIQTIAPSARSFSLVVACGKGALQKQQTAPLPQSPPPLPQDQNESPVRLTNRQILMVVKPKQESLGSLGTGPSISSSIPDTSSLTSEETLDSNERKALSSADVESNEGSWIAGGAVEYVDAPVPKINPWVANRNAAQVLQGSTLPGFPSVSESSGSSTNGETHKPASPEPPKVEVQKTRKQSKEIQKPKPEVKAPQEHKTPPQSPTSFSEAVTSPKPKQEQPTQQKPLISKKQEPELPKKQNGESIARELSQEQKQAPATVATPALPQPPPLQDQKPVYVREMQNGFRPGRGRGSYSASASAGRKIPSRTSVLMKVISGDRAEDWPTLGEALSSRAHKLSCSGDEESGSGGEGVKKPTTAIGEDAVDSHVKVVDKVVELNNKSSEVSRKTPPPTQQPQQRTDLPKQQIPVSPPPTQNQNETTCSSDNDDDVNSSNKRRGSKQKWVPLDITTQEQRERYYEAPPPEYKGKPGKGKHKYPSNHRYEGGYPRAKGKENMGVNGGGEYSDYSYHRYGPPHTNHHNPRSNRPPNLPSRPPQQLANQPQNSRPPRRHNSNPHHHHHHHNQHHHHRSTSTLSLNNASAMNGSAHPYEILSPTGGPPDFADFAPDFTITPMYPAVSEFIMPYVTNGYFPTPFTPPAGVIVEPAPSDVVGAGPIVVATAAPPTSVPTTVAGAPIHGADIILNDLVRTQIEYYLSEENLAKDFYLRRKMDQDGYLPVHLIATFPRVKQMTENFAIVLSAIQSSETLELKQDMSNVRTRVNPEKWPIPDQPALSSSSLKESLDKTCINNNTHTSTIAGGGIETLNPNVPEFVPKSRVFC